MRAQIAAVSQTSTGKIKIHYICLSCTSIHHVIVSAQEYHNLSLDLDIQDACPTLTPTEREQIISGLCPKCQDPEFDSDQDQVTINHLVQINPQPPENK